MPVPEQLLLLVLATALSYACNWQEPPFSVPILGTVPAGLPTAMSPLPFIAGDSWHPPALAATPGGHDGGGASGGASDLPKLLPLELMFALLKPTLVVGAFSFILSMSIARTFALKYDYSVDSNQELLALGAANIFGAFFLSYPAAGNRQ